MVLLNSTILVPCEQQERNEDASASSVCSNKLTAWKCPQAEVLTNSSAVGSNN